jgi:hypothetical protein
MRYLDKVQIESPAHYLSSCARAGCDAHTPSNEQWTLLLRYAELEDPLRLHEFTYRTCSLACAELLASQVGAVGDDIHRLLWDTCTVNWPY